VLLQSGRVRDEYRCAHLIPPGLIYIGPVPFPPIIGSKEHTMTTVRVTAFLISLDGFGAGLCQDLNNPLGVRGLELHAWFQEMILLLKHPARP
jgi:hypothetical protein